MAPESHPSGPARIARAYRNLRPEQRLAGFGAVALFVTMFLPWYSYTAVAHNPDLQDKHLSAWAAFSFVEAAVLLVALFILLLLFERGEDRPFHLPGGDGTVITGAGVWVVLLVFYRLLDKPDGGHDYVTGVTWGIFFTLLVGLFIAYAGQRLRVAHVAEPHNARAGRPTPASSPTRVAEARRRAAPPPATPEQMSFDEPPAEPPTAPTQVAARPRPRRPLPWEEDGPPEFEQRPPRGD